MKLRTKLTLGFATIALLVLITNLIAFNRVAAINRNLTIISENSLPGIKALLNIRISQTTINTIEKELMAKNLSDSLREKAYKRLKNAIHREETLDSTYASLPKPEEEMEGYNNFRQLWNDYLLTHEGFMKIEALFRSDRTEETYNKLCNYNLNETQKAYDKVTKQLNQLIKMNTLRNDEVRNESLKLKRSASWILWISTILGLILSITIGWHITKTVIKDLGEEPSVVAGIAEQIAQGNLSIQINNAGNNSGILGSVEAMTNKLHEVVVQIEGEAQNTMAAGQELSAASGQISSMTIQQAASLEEVSSSMEEMVANIQQSANNALATEKIAKNVSEGIRLTNDEMKKTFDAVKEITSKIKVINEIAFQTNLLALNAAVEAARAGTQGKGFAVVASEVRKLSERSREAADVINSLSQNCVLFSEKALSQILVLAPEMEKTMNLVVNISSSSAELESGAELINQAIQNLNEATQNNAGVAELLNKKASNLLDHSSELKNAIAYFKTEK
jgi:methyl-accepting chemotaxis protein